MSKKWLCLVACVTMLALVGNASATLVGHWKLDEGSGTTVADSSGNGYNGTVQGNPTWGAGVLGGAMECDGDDWVDCGDILQLSDGFTLMCWINIADTSGEYSFVSRNASYAFKAYQDHLRYTTPGILDYDASNSILEAGTWQHVAVSFVPNQDEGAIFYVNGVETDRLTSTGINAGSDTFYIANNQWSQYLNGAIDDARVYDTVLTAEEIADSMYGSPGTATNPSPEDEAIDLLRDVVLGWDAGDFAVAHDVYLGTSYDDVNDASRSNTLDVLLSQGQAGTTCDAGRLVFGQTYYWRVDEVNAAPDNTIFKGDVWSFTTEPLAYPVSGVTASTNAASEDGSGPEKMVDGSGLDADDQHSTETGDMWQAQVGDADPVQIDFAFDKVYCLDEIMVWNCNTQFETMLGFGIKNVTVEYSADGETWTVQGDVDLAQGTGMTDYTANTVIDLGGVAAQYVKFTVNSRYSASARFGLSEVRFLSIPVHASQPAPADGDADVSVEATLAWRPGRQAASHEVYLGTDPNALSLAGIADDITFTPDALDLAMTYYWRIDEANDAEAISLWQGDLWSFSTQDYIVLEDFESFNDEDNLIYETWIDGWVNETGSTVGYLEAPFAETDIVHGGSQAMPLFYNNSSATTSEAEYALSQDWTANGIQSLSLFFCGDADNEGGQLYVAINGTKIPYDGSTEDVTSTVWLPWNIDLSTVAGNLSNVTSLIIGVEGNGANGVLYIDDIRLYPETPEVIVPTMPDETNLVAYFAFEGDFSDSAGSHTTTVLGGAEIVSDATQGQVLSLDGNGDFVDVTYSADLNAEAFTASVWANPDPSGIDYRSPLSARDEPPQSGYILYLTPDDNWAFWVGNGSGWSGITGPLAQLGEWVHLGATGQNEQQKFYVNGVLVAEGTAALSLNTQRPLRIGGGATESETGNYFFYGLLDEVRIYDRILSDEEVAGLAGRTDPLHKAF